MTIAYELTTEAAFRAGVAYLSGLHPLSGLGEVAYTDPNSSNSDPKQNGVYAYANGMQVDITADTSLSRLEALVRAVVAS